MKLTDEQIEGLQVTLPKKEEIDPEKYLTRAKVKSDYVLKTEMTDIINNRLQDIISKRNEIENKLAEANGQLKEYAGIDINEIKGLKESVKEFQGEKIEKAKSLIEQVQNLDNEQIQKKFIIPEDEDAQDFNWANKFVNKFQEYQEIGVFQKDEKFIQDKKGGQIKKKKWDDPLDKLG